jgi:hypothetical protein
MRTVLLSSLVVASLAASALSADTGGPLSADQAAYDVLAYDLDLAIDPAAERLDGVVTIEARENARAKPRR